MAAILGKTQELMHKASDNIKETMGKKEPGPGERKVSGYAVYGATMKPKSFSYVAPKLKDDYVEIQIECCGVCHTDIAMINNEVGMSKYPFIPGHEIVGRVTAIGPAVTLLSPGMRVGVGWFKQVDKTCPNCMKGNDNLCTHGIDTIGQGEHGGWAEYIHVQELMAFKIPDNLPSERAAPLLCAGITVFAPLINHNITAGQTVGVIGMGGLGHLFVKFAAAMGCKVVVFSTTKEKEQDAIKFGASKFVLEGDKAAFAELVESIDFLFSTRYDSLDVPVYLGTVKPNGTLVQVGWLPIQKPIGLPVLDTIYRQKHFAGSNVGNSENMRKMLDFASKHNILPEIETYKFEDLPDAVQRFVDEPKTNRYRLVVTMPISSSAIPAGVQGAKSQ